MTDPRGRKRSLISRLFALFVVGAALLVLAVMRVGSLFRPKYVPIAQLKFPVLVIQPNGVALFAAWDSTELEKFPEHSTRTPVDGTVIIDSAFDHFEQVNVKRKAEGDLKQIGRFLFPGMMRVKYTFDLKRRDLKKVPGRDVMMGMIRVAPAFSDDPAEEAALRRAAQQQTTMDSVLNALHFYKPVEPATQPMTESVIEQNSTNESTPMTTEAEPGTPNPEKLDIPKHIEL